MRKGALFADKLGDLSEMSKTLASPADPGIKSRPLQNINNFKHIFKFYFMCMSSCLYLCLFHMHAMPMVSRRGHQMPWKRSSRCELGGC